MADLKKIAARATEVLKFSYKKENYLPVPEWNGLDIPPVEVHRVNIVNNALNMAGLYAAKARAFAGEDGWKPLPDWAVQQSKYMEREMAKYKWAKTAPAMEIWKDEVKFYGISV